jgi:uncharacterized protein
MDLYWKALGAVGLEHLTLRESQDGIHADGLVIRHHQGLGFRLRYHLDCDPNWKFRTLHMETLGYSPRTVQVSSDRQGCWFDANGQPLDFLQGCFEADIMATPFTNTLTIKRLGLAVGESQEIEVVYFTIPALELQRIPQRYTCLARDDTSERYRYERLNSGFQAELLFDAHQLILTYEGVWKRLDPSQEH